VTLHLKGLHCLGYESAVKFALLKVPGVESATVSAKTQSALVALCREKAPREADLRAVVKKAGYELLKVEAASKPEGKEADGGESPKKG
jgi:Cation transport ATPase